MTDNQPPPVPGSRAFSFQQALAQILQQQQQLFSKLSEQLDATQRCFKELSRDDVALESLASNITEFNYDPDQGCTFDAWFCRYSELFDKDAAKLDDAAKVRLLMRKLSPAAHERYTSFVLPKLSKEFSFAETTETLKKLFGSPVSVFHRRFQCLQTAKEDSEDILAYSCKVNRMCVDFKLSDISEEHFKCLIFVCGLKSPKDTDIRMRLINKLNESADVTLAKIVEESRNLMNLKSDNVMVEKLSQPAVNSVNKSDSKFPKQHRKSSSDFGNKTTTDQPRSPCWACGGMHFAKECHFRDHQCRECGKRGHREGYCACFLGKSAGKQKSAKHKKSTKVVSINAVNRSRKYAEVLINNVPVRLQVDSASDISVITEALWKQIGKPAAHPPSCQAITASGDPLPLASEFWCDVNINGTSKRGLCYVASPKVNLSVLGTDWIEMFGLWDVPFNTFCNQVTSSTDPSSKIGADLQSKFSEVFTSRMGLCTKTKVQLSLRGNPKPVFRGKRPVSYSMEGVVEDEIQRLVNLGVLQPVDFSDWAAPIVVVRKPNGTVRICADFSTGLNSVLEANQNPLPLPEDIFTSMSGCRFFTHIDLSDAYLQVQVDENSQHLLTINTHKGLFRFTRLSPGIKSAPGAFQQIVDAMLSGLQCTRGYLDDLLVGGKSEDELNRNVHQVLSQLQDYGFTVRIEKCRFNMRQIKYLGQILDTDGIRPDPDKVSAIAAMPAPHDVPTLRSYLGAVNYYSKYIPEMRQLRFPMDQLLKTGVKWEWSGACQQAFDRFKKLLQSPLALTHYDPKQEIIVSADASSVGIGARIAHRFPDGTIKAVCHASRSLTPAETNYSQIEKEGLALIFAVTRFHRMLFGRHFTLETDHKPLLAIFGSKKGIPIYTANRLQSFGHADVLSRLINTHIRPDEEFVIASIELEKTIHSVVQQSLEVLPLTFKAIQAETQSDPILKQVLRFVQQGWPKSKSDLSDTQLQQFYLRRDGLSSSSGCLTYGERLVIPAKFHKKILHQLHKGHPGVDRMRSISRNYVYWPGIDDSIAQLVRACTECASVAKTNRKTTLESWPAPTKPWQRIHIDYAGPVDGMYYLILVDAFSKWPEVVPTKRITTADTLIILRSIFARFGMSETLVSDNGRQLVSEEFERYCEVNGILHLKTPPFHPQSNGLAERFVDTFKRTLKKITAGGEVLAEAIDTFLLCYRSTPCRGAPDGKTPAEVLLGRPVRTSLDLLKPPSQYFSKTTKQDQQFNRKHGAKARSYERQDLVWAKVYENNSWCWEPGQILERVGNVIYNVWLPQKSKLIRSHCNQMRQRCESAEESIKSKSSARIPLSILLDSWGLSESNSVPEDNNEIRTNSSLIPALVQQEMESTTRPHRRQPHPANPLIPRHSSRTRRAPVRYEPYHLY
ncbi:uncharacterized protein K02A2.6-like [Uranotaenia lowii]|uniref:uncharacterized protein K02A2.6-like n=1 Tax=Uranotaenia lowii TaxID=190385 RepID=UPI00247AF452|nr:uncharacterized protein K02A2.6-like [Uranotaenia lowii]